MFKSDLFGLPLMAALGFSAQSAPAQSALAQQVQQVQQVQLVRQAQQAQQLHQVLQAQRARQAQQVQQAQQAHQAQRAQQAQQELDALSLQVAEACEACELEDWLVWEGNDFLRVAEDDDLLAAQQELDALSLQVAEACEACELEDWLVWEGNDFLRVAEDDDLMAAPLQCVQYHNCAGELPDRLFETLPGFGALPEPATRYCEVDGARYAVLTSRGTTLQRRRRVCLEGGGGKCDRLARDSNSKRCRKHGGGVKCARRACLRLAVWDSASLKFTKFCAVHGGGSGA